MTTVSARGTRRLSADPWLVDGFAAIVLTLVGAAIAYGLMGSLLVGGIDDAAITQVYARNIAAGHGYVYNPGGEWVEGSTSLAWTVLNAAVFGLFADPVPVLHGLSAVIATATVLVWLRTARGVAAATGASAAVTVAGFLMLMAGLAPFWLWMVWSLMDVTLWALVVALAVHLSLRIALDEEATDRTLGWLAGMLALAVVTRPDGVALAAGMAALTGLVLALRPGGQRKAAVFTAGTLGLVLGVFALLVAWRLATFGYPLPNTYYAKTSANMAATLADGVKYLINSLVAERLFLPALAAAALLPFLVAFRANGSRHRGDAREAARRWADGTAMIRGAVLPAVLLGFLAIVVLSGGDHFNNQRFLVPIAPALMLALAVTGARLAALAYPAVRPAIGPVGLAIGLAGLAGLTTVGPLLQFRYDVLKGDAGPTIHREFSLRQSQVTYGAALAAALPATLERPALGVLAAGGIALSYPGPRLDLLGLNWTEMAHKNPDKTGLKSHASFDADTFLAHAPGLVQLSCPISPFEDAVTRGIVGTERFRALYTPVTVDLAGLGARTLFARRDIRPAMGDAFRDADC